MSEKRDGGQEFFPSEKTNKQITSWQGLSLSLSLSPDWGMN